MLTICEVSSGQISDSTRTDTLKIVRIQQAARLMQITTDSGRVLQALAGNAVVQHENTILSGDSIVFDPLTSLVEVFNNVHVNDGDSVHTSAGYLRYVGKERKAYLKKNVILKEKKGTIYADEVVYDVATGIATYEGNGRVTNGSTKLTSRSAVYYSNTKDVYFKRNVRLTDPRYDIESDSLIYNTDFQTVTFIAPSRIRRKDGSVIETKSGTFNTKTGEAMFFERTLYRDSTRFLIGNHIAFEDKTGNVQIEGNGKVVDSVNRLIILGNQILINKKKQTFLATRKPVMIFYRDNDSTYISADTLFSGLMSGDSSTVKKQSKTDTIKSVKAIKTNGVDSIRYFLGFHHVRIFNDSMQAASDSLYYSTADSSFKLFYNPVCWSNRSQISGDTLFLFMKNNKPATFRCNDNSSVMSKTSENLFNQISGRILTGTFNDGTIEYARMKGSPAECIYYPMDDDSAYAGMNRSSGDVIDIFFRDKTLNKVKFVNNVDGTLYPLDDIPADIRTLPGCIWQEDRRPKSKFALFE